MSARRQLFTLAILLLVSALGATRLLTGPWDRAAEAVEPWRADLADAAVAEEDADAVAVRELVLRLNADNLELRRRLAEYHEVAGASGVAVPQAVLARARVTARSQRRGRHFIELDLGAVDGVENGMAVTVGWSLVGVVCGEQLGRSLVRLLTDQDSRIPAHLLPAPSADVDPALLEPLALGVCAGTGDRDLLELRFVEDRPGLRIEPGMSVLSASSGPGSQVPPRLVIGTVLSAEREEHSDHWRIAVRPLRDARHAATLLVLRPGPPAAEPSLPEE